MRATSPDAFGGLLDRVRGLLPHVSNPAQYLGGEFNLVRKDPRALRGRMALCYPDTYEVGSSHNGLQILYRILNDVPGLCAERCYTPWPDMADRMRAQAQAAQTELTDLIAQFHELVESIGWTN